MLYIWKSGLVTGTALTSLMLTLTTWHPTHRKPSEASLAQAELERQFARLPATFALGQCAQTSSAAIQIADDAHRNKLYLLEARSHSVAGSCYLIELRLRDALKQYQLEKDVAKLASNRVLISFSDFNLASVYLQLDDAASAYRHASEGLRVAAAIGETRTAAGLKLQLARALTKLDRFNEAIPLYRSASNDFEDLGIYQSASLGWHMAGTDAMDAGNLEVAEASLDRALYLARMHQLQDVGSVLRKLARLRAKQGDIRSADLLFSSAIASPTDTTPRWLVYADRGEFRISQHDYLGAFADFHEARDRVRRFRADVVPSDQGRVNLENGLSRIAEGFIEAGNQQLSSLATDGQRKLRMAETFDVAEQDRSTSLAALTPIPHDWRSRLPAQYWDLLNRYRSLERGEQVNPKVDSLRLQISQMEATAGSDARTEQKSALQHVRSVLQAEDVFLSFHLGKRQSWLWMVDRNEVKVFPLPSSGELDTRIQAFRQSVRLGSPGFEGEGRALYKTLFGKLPATAGTAKRWMVELDGPLFDLPLAALVLPANSGESGAPVFLGEKVALQLVPAAPLMRKGRSLAGGTFVGVADPIYNAADSRYRGTKRKPPMTLPRLPSSQSEVEACAREYAPGRSTLLTGSHANLPALLKTLTNPPTILHFATHIITSPGEYHSGLIALGLDQAGEMDLLGPVEIVARKVEAELVVLNGCQSGQAQRVPGSGLMGLTRAWIGSGANAVLATRWDVPDEDGQALMLAFYQSIREHPEENVAFALQRARQTLLRKDEARRKPSTWAAYFLFART